MKNFIQQGETLDYTNSSGADIASGDPVVVGKQIGVAINDIANGESGPLAMTGVYELPKVSGQAISLGDAVVWDASNNAFGPSSTMLATGDVSKACTAWEAAASGDTTVKVKINTGVGTVT